MKNIKEIKKQIKLIDLLIKHCFKLETILMIEDIKTIIITVNGEKIPCFRF